MGDPRHLRDDEAGSAPGTADTDADARVAAGELAAMLKGLADRLAGEVRPQRVPYGKGRLGNSLRRRSPEGFLLDAQNLQLLLPDGRLWSYSRSDAVRYPTGRYFDVHTDYANFARGRSFFGGRPFIFLGAVLGRYTFGLADQDGTPVLCALSGEGKSVRYVDAAAALADIADHIAAGRDPKHSSR